MVALFLGDNMTKFTSLIILDGYGWCDASKTNAISESGASYIANLVKKYPQVTVGASGLDVGLPDGQMGNSEVGHLNIGAGRIVYQELTRITKSIKDGDFFSNDALVSCMDKAVKSGKALHLFGLLSDGGVHSHVTHLYALLDMAKQKGVKDTFVHCFMDGRDVPPSSGKDFVIALENKMKSINYGKIASISGRFYAMDRDNRWERVERAFNALTMGEGNTAQSAVEIMDNSYANGVTDEFVEPTVVVENGNPVGTIKEGDSIVFFNFRPDRAREITKAFIYPEFDAFNRKCGFLKPNYVSFTQYDETFTGLDVAFKPQTLNNTLGEYLASKGIKQLRIAETEKYAHVTFFFNGGVEKANEGEERVLIASPKVATYDLKPEMSAYEVADKAVECINSGKYDVMILNFANCDMVGHTGVMGAAKDAVVAVENCLEKVIDAILSVGGQALITADHGNADKMADCDGNPFTAHTTAPVPLILVGSDKGLKDGGILADIAPTMLDMMGLEKPIEMAGKSLLK